MAEQQCFQRPTLTSFPFLSLGKFRKSSSFYQTPSSGAQPELPGRSQQGAMTGDIPPHVPVGPVHAEPARGSSGGRSPLPKARLPRVPERGCLGQGSLWSGNREGKRPQGDQLWTRPCSPTPGLQRQLPLSAAPRQLGFVGHVGCFCCLVSKSCPTLLRPPGLLCLGDSPGGNPGVGCHFLLQGIFSTQGSNPRLLCLLRCRWILYPLSHQGSPTWVRHVGKLTHLPESPCSCLSR